MNYGGGGSGWMNNVEFNNLTPGQNISIIISDAGNASSTQNGGTTSFGTYLSANGGSGSDGGAGGIVIASFTSNAGNGYQFGGGGFGYSRTYSTNVGYGYYVGGIYGGGGQMV